MLRLPCRRAAHAGAPRGATPRAAEQPHRRGARPRGGGAPTVRAQAGVLAAAGALARCRARRAAERRAAASARGAPPPLELVSRLDALQWMQALRQRPLPPSRAVQGLSAAISRRPGGLGRDMEGHCAPEQLEFLRGFVAEQFGHWRTPARMCQVGFNAGHSAAALLADAPEGSVLLSIDLCGHEYTKPLERVVAQHAEERGQTHILLEGDSLEMLPRFQHIDFDLIFIDGNHAYEAVALDFWNCLSMATADTRVLLNHVFTDMEAESAGPTRVWLEALEAGNVRQEGWHSCCSRHGIMIGRSLLTRKGGGAAPV